MSELPIAGSYRPTVMGREGVVASGHYLASLAAQRILDRGGNAVDAGVAAGLCTGVLQTGMVDLAGVAPIVIYLADVDRVVTISGLGRRPCAASVEYFRRHHEGRIPLGVERSIAPAAPDALDHRAPGVRQAEPGGCDGGCHHAGRARRPAMVFKHEPSMPIGTPGGDVQCQAMLQVFLNVAVFGLLPQAAIEAPRFATYSYPGSFEPHAYQPDELRVERRLADEVGGALADRGHRVVTWPDWTWRAGGVCTITIDRERGVLAAGADPRRTSYAIGW